MGIILSFPRSILERFKLDGAAYEGAGLRLTILVLRSMLVSRLAERRDRENARMEALLDEHRSELEADTEHIETLQNALSVAEENFEEIYDSWPGGDEATLKVHEPQSGRAIFFRCQKEGGLLLAKDYSVTSPKLVAANDASQKKRQKK